MKTNSVLLLAAMLFPLGGYAEDASTLDSILPKERQQVLGFDKLTERQRAEVLVLLQEVYQLGVQNGSEQANRATPNERARVIESSIDGEFEGWEGETIVKLMNGQIWQQIEYHYHYHYAYMPEIVIYETSSGYKMKVDGIEKAVGVERLK